MSKEIISISDLGLQSLNNHELRETGIYLMDLGISAIRQLTSENYNGKVKDDIIFLLSDSIHKLPKLCLSHESEETNRDLILKEIDLVMMAFCKFNEKFPHKRISFEL
jgi:hypothetical protein